MKQVIKKGQWYSFCCDQDLVQAEEDFVYDDDEEDYDVWDSELEALAEIRERCTDQGMRNEIKLRIDKLQIN